MKITVLSKSKGKIIVDAKPLLTNLKGQGCLRFFVRENIYKPNVKEKEASIRIVIIEFSSGCVFAMGYDEQDAIEMLKMRVEKYGEEKIIDIAKKTVLQNGFKYPVNE